MIGDARAGQRLLLLVALLFGLATMHTVGHPSPPAAAATALPAPAAPTVPMYAFPALASSTPTGATPRGLTPTGSPSTESPSTATGAAPKAHNNPATGHPTSTTGTGTGTDPASRTAHAPVSAPAPVPAPETAAHLTATAANHSGQGGHGDHGEHQGHGMDPSLVCLAVLGAWAVALLVVAGAWLGRWFRAVTTGGTGARTLRALWPEPPPPRHLLARLSVLRI